MCRSYVNFASSKSSLFHITKRWFLVACYATLSATFWSVGRSQSFLQAFYYVSHVFADLSREYSVFNYSVEVSARGQVTKDNRARIKSLVWKCCRQPKGVDKNVTKLMSKAAILTSFTLFSARKEPAWSSPSPLIVRQF